MKKRTSEIAFIDPAVTDAPALLAGLRPDVEPIVLEPAPAQIARALLGRAALDAIHIVAHGRPGAVQFASGALALDTLHEHAPQLASIGEALGEGAPILLWSCRTGQGDAGAAFVDSLARAAGAPVAAAADRVGAASLGGRWMLDAGTPPHTVQPPLTPEGVARYPGILATITGDGNDNTLLDNAGTSITFTNVFQFSVTTGAGNDQIY